MSAVEPATSTRPQAPAAGFSHRFLTDPGAVAAEAPSWEAIVRDLAELFG